MEAVVVNAEALFYLGKERIAKLALGRRLPTCAWVREVSAAGTLLSYGADQRAIARRVPYYLDRILQGEKPGEIPVEQPTTLELCVNLATAKALGLTLSPALLTEADEVIEWQRIWKTRAESLADKAKCLIDGGMKMGPSFRGQGRPLVARKLGRFEPGSEVSLAHQRNIADQGAGVLRRCRIVSISHD
ncbi:ABC transporter substrate binding protein [Bradyrhizobium sp.]|uniref:ABC transporter substrate binding protein n=1 Tax=Bradyrhizobium sp. TaxID=376 RepID=UPI003C5D7941